MLFSNIEIHPLGVYEGLTPFDSTVWVEVKTLKDMAGVSETSTNMSQSTERCRKLGAI